MTDAYNIAVKYLQSKYGKVLGYTSSFSDRLRKARNQKEYKEITNTATDRDREIVIIENAIKDKDDKYLFILTKQYYLGIAPKKELEYLLSK